MNKNESKYFNTAVKMDRALIELLEKKNFEYITIIMIHINEYTISIIIVSLNIYFFKFSIWVLISTSDICNLISSKFAIFTIPKPVIIINPNIKNVIIIFMLVLFNILVLLSFHIKIV